ncbi:poly(3-hydroxybutyrate) depolymerase [Thaumasiovibrio subtropicus]|nr:poly(3-hydroxybutyrate) depolymerase [Thaumasiovibrio subtropicus]
MTSQFHVAYSKDLVGVGVVAGGPWQCAASDPDLSQPLMTATSLCVCDDKLFNCTPPDVDLITQLAKKAEANQEIDALENLVDDRVYLFSGENDRTVPTGVVSAAKDFYQQMGVAEAQINYDHYINAGHGFLTNVEGDVACPKSKSPYINDCEREQAKEILKFIYPDLKPRQDYIEENLITFDQTEFVEPGKLKISSMNHEAFAYIPSDCQGDASQCRVHVAIHGCEQGVSKIGMKYVEGTGYLGLAEANNLIVVFPQVKSSAMTPFNPKGCWDFWGYTDHGKPPYTYYTKNAVQMKAIKSMIDRLTGV